MLANSTRKIRFCVFQQLLRNHQHVIYRSRWTGKKNNDFLVRMKKRGVRLWNVFCASNDICSTFRLLRHNSHMLFISAKELWNETEIGTYLYVVPFTSEFSLFTIARLLTYARPFCDPKSALHSTAKKGRPGSFTGRAKQRARVLFSVISISIPRLDDRQARGMLRMRQ